MNCLARTGWNTWDRKWWFKLLRKLVRSRCVILNYLNRNGSNAGGFAKNELNAHLQVHRVEYAYSRSNWSLWIVPHTTTVCVFSNKSTLGYMMQEFWMLPFLSSRSGTKVNAVYVCDEKGAGSGSGDSELVVTCDQAYFISGKTWEITRVMLTESLIACYLPMKSKRTLIPRLRFMEAILIKL